MINNKDNKNIIFNNNHNLNDNNNKMNYNDDELNDLPYNTAIIYDKRTL